MIPRALARAVFSFAVAATANASAARETDAQPAFAVRTALPTQRPLISVVNRTRGGEVVAPGTTVTLVFSLSAESSGTLLVSPAVAVPEGWRVVGGAGSLVVEAGKPELWTAGVTVPRSARAGSFRIALAFTVNGEAVTSDTVEVNVARTAGVNVSVAQVAAHAPAGGSYEAVFLVRNSGNDEAQVRLRITSSAGTPRLGVPEHATIAAGGSLRVPVAVALGRFPGVQQDILELTAVALPQEVRIATRTAIVRRTARGSRFSTVPAQLRLAATAGQQRVTPAAFSATGRIDDRDASIDLLLRAPTRYASVFSEPDEYRVALRTQQYAVQLGDHAHSLSPLTTSGGNAFGLGAEYRLGRMKAAGYSSRSRLSPAREREHGASVSVSDIGPGVSSFTLAAVARPQGIVQGNVASVSASTWLGDLGQLEAEYAGSRTKSGEVASARRARLWGDAFGLAYDFSHQSAGRSFSGPQRGGAYSYAGASLPLPAGLRARAYVNRFENVAHDSTAGLARRVNGSEAVVLETPAGLSFEVARTLRSSWADDTLATSHFPTARVALVRGAGPFSLAANLATGLESRDYLDVSVTPTIQIGNHRVGVQYTYLRGAGGSTSSPVTTAALNGTFALPFATTASFNAVGWRPGPGSDNWALQTQARLSHQFASGSSVALRVHRSAIAGAVVPAGERIYALEYTLPFRLPVASNRSAGRAVGRVIDSSGEPVAGAVVWLGERAAVTDKRGRVEFFGLAAGTHSAGLGSHSGRATSGAGTQVHVAHDRHSPADFTLRAGAGGRVIVTVVSVAGDRTQLSGEEQSPVPLVEVLVGLLNGRDTVYQVTDREGNADFGLLVPGPWAAVVVHSDIPPFTMWEHDRVDVPVRAGGEARVVFKLMPRKRTVVPSGSSSDDSGPPVVLRLSAVQPAAR